MHLHPVLRARLIWMAFNRPWNSWLITAFSLAMNDNRMIEWLDERTIPIRNVGSVLAHSNAIIRHQNVFKSTNSKFTTEFARKKKVFKWNRKQPLLLSLSRFFVGHAPFCVSAACCMHFCFGFAAFRAKINNLAQISANQTILGFFVPQFIAWAHSIPAATATPTTYHCAV